MTQYTTTEIYNSIKNDPNFDDPRVFVEEYLPLTVDENEDDVISLERQIAGHITQYLNSYNITIDRNDFALSLITSITNMSETMNNVFNTRINQGWFKYELRDNDSIMNGIKQELYETKYKTIILDEFNKLRSDYYITKDKNVFVEHFDDIAKNVPKVAAFYDHIYKDFENQLTEIKSTIKKRLDQRVIILEFNVNDPSMNFKLKALTELLETAIDQGKITLEDKFIYIFLIKDTWKTFTLRSFEAWDKFINSLKYGSLVFNLENVEQLFWSDGFYNKQDQVLPDLTIIQAIKLQFVPNMQKRGDNSGEFFRCTIKDEYLQLEPLLINAQIFNTLNDGKHHRPELDYNCFCYALKIAAQDDNNLGISRKTWNSIFEDICKDCIGRNVSIKDIKELVSKYNLYVHLTTFSFNDKKRNRANNRFGDKDKAILTCNLGIFKQESNFNHFFYNYKVPVSKYFIQHIDDILNYAEDHRQPIEWAYRVTRFRSNCYATDKTKFKPIEMIDFIYNLYKSNVFQPLTQNDTIDLDSDVHYYTPSDIESLTGHENNIKAIKYKEPITTDKNGDTIVIRYFYADFEADPTANEHIPYCCSVCERSNDQNQLNMKTFYGFDCTEQLLKYLLDKSVTYFHNFGYDGRFIAKYGVRRAINKNSKIMNMNVNYDHKTLKFKDSYTMITMPLKRFPTMFKNVIDNSKIQKELFPYNYYNIDNVNNNVGTISEAGINEVPQWNEDHYKTFNDNIDKINNCRIDNNHFNMEKYCKFYCEQDVRILALGHTEFRRLTLMKPIEMDIDHYISAPSLSNAFFTKNVYSKIPQLKQYSGVYREFIQKGVYGGRCMTNSNKKYHRKEGLVDFDACSLYPTSMHRLYLPTGAPQECTEEMLQGSYLIDHVLKENELTTNVDKPLSAFFVEIDITKVGKHLQFPLICKRTKQGNSNVNECCTMYVDNYAFEDLIKYQDIKYIVKRGYYWTGNKSSLLSKVIRQIYDLRVQYKKEGNPLQEVLKLIMNSAYGKTIQKPIDKDFVYKSNYVDKTGTSRAERYLSKNFHKIEEMFEVGDNITAFKTIKGIDDHYVSNFIGVQILSMSKRIMNEVMCTAEDLNIPIYYQDTDSMHITVGSLELLENEFGKRFDRNLIGSDMGQFHSDFEHKDGGKEIVSIESYFLGKKAYCDKLINENGDVDYHLRMKGIPNECLKMYAKKVFNDEPLELYDHLFKGNYINFNILDVKPSFEMKNDMTIHSRSKFTRKIKF